MLHINKPIREGGKNSREEKRLDWTGGMRGMSEGRGGGTGERASEWEEREREEDGEGCSSVSAPWSCFSWDSRTLSTLYTSKSITLDWTKKTRVHGRARKQAHIHTTCYRQCLLSLFGFNEAASACQGNVRKRCCGDVIITEEGDRMSNRQQYPNSRRNIEILQGDISFSVIQWHAKNTTDARVTWLILMDEGMIWEGCGGTSDNERPRTTVLCSSMLILLDFSHRK